MKTIILAGGYGARLQEDIQRLERTDKKAFEYYKKFLNIPKPLLPLQGKPLLNYIFEKLEEIQMKEVIIRTNAQNYPLFVDWKETYKGPISVDVISDSSAENKHGQGVFGGVLFILEKKKIQEDILILAGDTLFDYGLTEVMQIYNQKKKSIIVVHKERPELIRLRGVVQFDEKKRILSYEEKPNEPKSMYAATPTFVFDEECVKRITNYMIESKNDQNMGNIVPWLLTKGKEIGVYQTEKEIFDIGNVTSVKLAEEFLARRKKERRDPSP